MQPIHKGKFLFSIFSLLLCCSFSNSFSQTFNNNSSAVIPDNGIINIPITVTELGNNIDATNFGLQSVTIDITHADVQQLTLSLESPDGTSILLAKNLPGVNYSQTKFNATSVEYIDFGNAPYNGSYRPLQDLSILNNSQNPNGTWKLTVSDNAVGIVGDVQSVSLNFGTSPAKPLLSSSNLPIVKIYTNGQDIIDEPKIIADMYLIDNGPGVPNDPNQTTYVYAGKIGIEIRGHSSQQFPKKQFGFETREDNGVDDKDVSLLGMPKESDWILNANYADKSLMRNTLTYKLASEMDQYASRSKFCEVLINDEYRGVYVLQEKIKRDKNRVNVEKLKLTDVTPPEITGGYIFSIDKLNGGEVTWRSELDEHILFQFVYPKKPKDIAAEQLTYLRNYVDSFEQSLNGADFQDPTIGFREFADDSSFMKFFIINELSRNVDGYRISSYFNKSRNGKIIAGPVWDFDIAWGNANYDNGSNPEGFVYLEDHVLNMDYQVPFWWAKLRSDVKWNKDLINMYQNLRGSTLSQSHINFLIDSMANDLKDAQQRNFTRWNILGQYVWPNPMPVPQDYDGEINYLKNFITNRMSFLDANLAAALPLEMISFTASPENNNIKLKWITQNEYNTDHFDVEKSLGSGGFKKIGIVQSQNSPAGSSYTFDDKNIINGPLYYRLKQVDKDGGFNYSKIIGLNSKNAAWKIYPNKTHSQLTLISPSPDNKKIQINIFNMVGQKVSAELMQNNTTIYKDVSGLASGNYVLEIIDNSGHKTTLRFIKE